MAAVRARTAVLVNFAMVVEQANEQVCGVPWELRLGKLLFGSGKYCTIVLVL